MKQLYRLQGWTDRQSYRIGDSLHYSTRCTNLADRALGLVVPSAYGGIGHLFLYRDKDYPLYWIGPVDVILWDIHANLLPEEHYAAQDGRSVPSGTYEGDTFLPLYPANYIVYASVRIEDTGYTIPDAMLWFMINNWNDLHRGPSPRYDNWPNKWEFPHVQIME